MTISFIPLRLFKREGLRIPSKVVSNLRLMIENFMKDVKLGILLYSLVPCHLFIAYVIELAAAQQAKGALGRDKRDEASEGVSVRRRQGLLDAWPAWRIIALAHGVNATLCLGVSTATVYWYIHHPLIGTLCELHAIMVWLKNCSYALTNRDLRQRYLDPNIGAPLPTIYSSCPYPQNITIGNLSYFWWAPTLVYQPVYPRTPRIRWSFVAKRVIEVAALSMFIWVASAQYAAPVLRNSLAKMQTFDITSILERLMKLSTISLVIWLAGFFASFQSALNGLAEVMKFADREFFRDWWNSPSVGAYWRTWNKPVYTFMRRHIYSPLLERGWSPHIASVAVFFFSGVLHELLVGIPTHNIIGVAFFGMLVQIPLIASTAPLEKMQGPNGKIIGNTIFWVSFCLVGQPLAALLYFFAWQAKYGSDLK
ncbi:MAG: hypothetical protein M1837_006217 [Sclerophora amabilis]|nr:MAG: hypothetical protein M1837_006217 [Sclerophora amabilis]